MLSFKGKINIYEDENRIGLRTLVKKNK